VTWELPAGYAAGLFDMGTTPWMVFTQDSREFMPRLPDGFADHVITDPPYDEHTHASLMSAAASKSTTRTTGRRGERPAMVSLDFEPLADVDALVSDLVRLSRRWALAFCSLEMLGAYRDAAGDSWVRAGFWHRPDGAPQFSGDRPAQAGEAVAVMHRAGRKRWNGGGHRAFWSCGVEHDDRVHPTQKPLALMMRLVEQFTDPGDLVFDPFCGSGTTGVACLRLGRRFVGVERDERYAALACERLRAESGGLSLSAARAGQVALL
jgi:site-specific DNA-methyltransferase (adenine-specific)